MGRPHTLTDELVDQLIDLVSNGYTYRDASRSLGIPENTFERWRRESKDADKGPLAYLARRLPEAIVMFKHCHLERIRKATDWRPHAWILERRFPEEYGRRENIILEDNIHGFTVAFDRITRRNVAQDEVFSPDTEPPA